MKVTAVAAVIGSAAIIAASLMLFFRWEIVAPNVNNVEFVIRLDRWTGTVALCPLPNVDNNRLVETGAEYNCEGVRQQEAAVPGSQTTGRWQDDLLPRHDNWQADVAASNAPDPKAR